MPGQGVGLQRLPLVGLLHRGNFATEQKKVSNSERSFFMQTRVHKKRIQHIIFVLLATSLVSCAPNVTFRAYTNQVFSRTYAVDVYRTAQVPRAYLELGELCVDDRGIGNFQGSNSISLLLEKAGEVGAHAIILIGQQTTGAVGIPAGSNILVSPTTRTCAVAIRYR